MIKLFLVSFASEDLKRSKIRFLRQANEMNIYEGIKIPTGVITIEDANGSRSIIPVSGMLGCNLEN